MKKNVSTPDRLIRVALAVLFLMLLLNNPEDKIVTVLTGIMAAYCLLTAILQVCLFYTLLKVSTRSSQ